MNVCLGCGEVATLGADLPFAEVGLGLMAIPARIRDHQDAPAAKQQPEDKRADGGVH